MVEEIKTLFDCDECKIDFPERALLASHMSSVHNGDRGNIRPTKVVTFKEDEGEISTKIEDKKVENSKSKTDNVLEETKVPKNDSENVVKLDYVPN